MPTIRLKPNSAEYADENDTMHVQVCEMPDCHAHGDHKAPKHRGLNEFYYFCDDHIRAYNKSWNFFEGMAAHEVQDHMERARYGDRPTWRYDADGSAEDALRNKAWQAYNFTEEDGPRAKEKRGAAHGLDPASPEFEALSLFGLEPPITLQGIKNRYKELAMKHHPDRNAGCQKSEELLKRINMAYTLLKMAYAKFDSLDERSA